MKDFRTELRVIPAGTHIHLKSGILTQGSCFSTAIGQRLQTSKLPVRTNPFGVIYNPESIHKALAYSILNEPVPDHTFGQHGDVFVNYDFHSAFSSLKKEELAVRLTETIGATHRFLKDCDWLLLTYGTAWIFRRNDTGEVVANCHKQPAGNFSRSLMRVESVCASFAAFYEKLKQFNPGVKVILTVSPVRHVKDTLELNSVSKSVLRVATHELANQLDDVEYFPAFEIMMDDLRDYRFYKADMLHPTEEAEDYIWEKFMERYFSAEARDFVRRWEAIRSALRHRPFHPQSSAHRQFLRDTLEKLEEIRSVVDVEEEISGLKQQIASHGG